MSSPRFPALLSTLTTAAVLITGSGCRDHQVKARADLQSASFSFTVGDFMKAAAAGRPALVASFLDAGMNPAVKAPDGTTALLAAASQGQGEVVRLLLSRGANPAVTGPDGLTPLLVAVRSGDERSVNALLQAGADPTRQGPQGETALAAAALLGHAALVEMLMPISKEPADAALRLACGKGHTAVMDVLLNAGAQINLADDRQHTPLMLAAMAGQLPAVKLLCHRQALTAPRDADQRTAAELARGLGHESTATFLEEWAARYPDPPPSSGTPALAAAASPTTSAAQEPTSSDPAPPPPAASAGSQGAVSTETAFLLPPVSEKTDSRSLKTARFPRLHCDAVDDVPGLLRMTSYQLRPLPFLLKDVDPGNEAADVVLTLEGNRIVSLRIGAEIPGTGCVIEKLRRRRVYTDNREQKLVNASELTLRRTRSDEVFRATPDTPVLSSDSSALVRITGSDTIWTATAGDEFRLGTTLLKVMLIEPKALTVENRLTHESIKVPISPGI